MLHDTFYLEALGKAAPNKGDMPSHITTSDTYIDDTNKKTKNDKCPCLDKNDKNRKCEIRKTLGGKYDIKEPRYDEIAEPEEV